MTTPRLLHWDDLRLREPTRLPLDPEVLRHYAAGDITRPKTSAELLALAADEIEALHLERIPVGMQGEIAGFIIRLYLTCAYEGQGPENLGEHTDAMDDLIMEWAKQLRPDLIEDGWPWVEKEWPTS